MKESRGRPQRQAHSHHEADSAHQEDPQAPKRERKGGQKLLQMTAIAGHHQHQFDRLAVIFLRDVPEIVQLFGRNHRIFFGFVFLRKIGHLHEPARLPTGKLHIVKDHFLLSRDDGQIRFAQRSRLSDYAAVREVEGVVRFLHLVLVLVFVFDAPLIPVSVRCPLG